MAITADYPGLLPTSSVSTQETSPQKEFSHCDSPTALHRAPKGRRSHQRAAAKASSKKTTLAQGASLKRKANNDIAGPSYASKRYNLLARTQQIDRTVTFPAVPYCRRSVRQTTSADLAGHAQTNPAPNPATRTGGDAGAMPDCHLPEDSDNVSVTNSEVESAMNHRRRRAAMRDPNFTEEAFNAFSSADAYIRAARDGLARATDQHLKDMRVSVDLIIIYQ